MGISGGPLHLVILSDPEWLRLRALLLRHLERQASDPFVKATVGLVACWAVL